MRGSAVNPTEKDTPMIHKLFTIYDEKAGAHLPIFSLPAEGMATRTFTDCINSADHQFGQHPADYTLFNIGNFDDITAEILLHDKRSLGNGVEFLHPPQPEDPNATRPIQTQVHDVASIQPGSQGRNSA